MSELFSKLKENPDNPRNIGKDEFENLKQSIRDLPQMLIERPIKYDESYVVLGGNMRLRALRELEKEGFEIKDEYFSLAKTLTTEDQKKEFIIKDNSPKGISGGWDWDILMGSEMWADAPLNDWGLEDIGSWGDENNEEIERLDKKKEITCPACGEVFTQ